MDKSVDHVDNDLDPEGLETLEVVARADKFNEWMYDTIRAFCKGEVLEIGSGIGNLSALFIRDSWPITLSDFRKSYCDELRNKFTDKAPSVVQIDLVHPDFNNQYRTLLKSFDTVFALNVVEHIEDDQQALKNCHSLLKEGGVVIILVPAYQWLYSTFDVNLGHFRRYTKELLNGRLDKARFQILHTQYFNVAGMLGWFVSGKLLKKRGIPGDQMKLFNSLVAIFRVIDKVFLKSFGLSVISVGRKTESI